jgi:hypothetical protein
MGRSNRFQGVYWVAHISWRGPASFATLIVCLGLAGSGCADRNASTNTILDIDRTIKQTLNPVHKTEGYGPVESVALPRWERVMVQQHEPVWCWAACAEMVHRYNGKKIGQAEIANRIYRSADAIASDDETKLLSLETTGASEGADHAENDPSVRTAQEYECIAALDPDQYDQIRLRDEKNRKRVEDLRAEGKNAYLIPSGGQNNHPMPDTRYQPDRLVEALRQEHEPVIVGLGIRKPGDLKHIVVVHAVDVQAAKSQAILGVLTIGENVNSHIAKATYTDPDTGADVDITGEELARRTDFMASRKQAHEFLRWVGMDDAEVKILPAQQAKQEEKKKHHPKDRRPAGSRQSDLASAGRNGVGDATPASARFNSPPQTPIPSTSSNSRPAESAALNPASPNDNAAKKQHKNDAKANSKSTPAKTQAAPKQAQDKPAPAAPPAKSTKKK